jgi:polysaccharide export outer membrane protein
MLKTTVRTTVFSLPTFMFAAALLVASHAAAQTTSNDSVISRQPVPSTPSPSASTPATSASAPSPATSTPARPTAKTTGAGWPDQEYRLGAGDKLRVEVFKQEQFSQSVQVRPDGKITLPFADDVMAAGRTPIELKDLLTTRLKEYLNNPVVTVIVQEAVAAQITVIGDVRTPSPQVMNGPMHVLQALARAGGPGEFADKNKIHIIRNGQNIPVNYKGMLKGEVEPIYLQPGDTIVVP